MIPLLSNADEGGREVYILRAQRSVWDNFHGPLL